MTNYEKLLKLEDGRYGVYSDIEITELSTGKTGTANTTENGVYVFYGNPDGSDDKEISAEDFNSLFSARVYSTQ